MYTSYIAGQKWLLAEHLQKSKRQQQVHSVIMQSWQRDTEVEVNLNN